MLVSARLASALGAAVKTFLAAFPFVEFEFVELAGCLRFLDELEDPAPSSGFAEKEDVPGIASLAAAALGPFTAVRLFREFDDDGAFSPSVLTPLVALVAAVPPLFFDVLGAEDGSSSRSMSMSRSSA
jgi:hypothetical protein